jgi:pyridoxamine 5'-phosphate oxidase
MSKPSGNSKPAPWRHLLDSHLKQIPEYEFTIATIGYDAQQRPVPRLRTCGCRGFFPELDLHPKGQEAMNQQVKGGGNPLVFESDMLCFTTDARMEKLKQLESSGHAIEAVFWLKDLMTQWRIKGTAYAIGDPNRENEQQEEASRAEIMKSLRVMGGNGHSVEGWTWENAVTKYFANHSPVARGMFLP